LRSKILLYDSIPILKICWQFNGAKKGELQLNLLKKFIYVLDKNLGFKQIQGINLLMQGKVNTGLQEICR